MTGLYRWRGWNDAPPPGTPYIADLRTFDIPETIAACIRNAQPGLVAITLSRRGGSQMIEAAEVAAWARGARVIWWWGPGFEENDAAIVDPEQAAAYRRQFRRRP